MRLTFFALAFFAVTTLPAMAAVSSDDATFVQEAQHDALGQYALATLAKNKAQSSTAKTLATQIATTSAQANDFIRTYAKSHGVNLDNQPSGRAGNQYGNISSDKGDSFDRDFGQAIYIDTNMSLDTYKEEAAHGDDPALRAFAKQQISAMEQLSKTAQKLAPQ